MLSSDFEGASTHLKRVPQQERSQLRFEGIVNVALRLFGEQGYEAVSMREIGREARVPIASVYQYFPTKQAIVKEIWLRYSQAIKAGLEGDISQFVQRGGLQGGGLLIEGGELLIDRMVCLATELQLSSPAYVEIWGCIAATPELRILNDQDTLNIATMVSEAIMIIRPMADRDQIEGMVLMLTESASAITKLTLSLPEEQRNRIIRQLKVSMKTLYKATIEAYVTS